MKKPFAHWDVQTIDERIEQIFHTFAMKQDDEDARCIQNLEYLLRQKAILAQARKRLRIVEQPEQMSTTHKSREAPVLRGPEESLWLFRSHHLPYALRLPVVAAVAAAILLIGALLNLTLLFNTHLQLAMAVSLRNNSVSTATVPEPLFVDALNANIHGWPIVENGPLRSFFRDGAYHITNLGVDSAVVIHPGMIFTQPWSYALTMTQVRGNTASIANAFGLIFAYTFSRGVKRFSTLEVINAPDRPGTSKIGLYTYDSSNQRQTWSELWTITDKLTGFVFGLQTTNTLQITTTWHSVTVIVNHQTLGSIQTQVGPGAVGMLVNLNGSEVAFQHLLITRS